jgi:hypothetical protein
MLEEVLKTQSPETAVIDVFTLLPASEVCYADGNFYVAIDEMTGKNRLEAADDIDNPDLITQYKYDFLMNHGNWKNMDVTDPGSVLNYKKELDEYVNFEMGYVRQEPYIYTPTPLIVYTADQKVELSEKEKAVRDGDCRVTDSPHHYGVSVWWLLFEQLLGRLKGCGRYGNVYLKIERSRIRLFLGFAQIILDQSVLQTAEHDG